MSRVLTVSKYTFIDLFKSRITLNVFMMGIALCAVSYISYSFTYGVPEKVALDVGLGLLSLSSVAVALFLGASLLSGEIEARTIYVVLSRSISRFQFLMGKILGLSLILTLNILILSFFTLGLYVLLGGSIQPLILWAISFIMLEALLVMMIAVFFSLITNKVLTILGVISLYIIGHAFNPVAMMSVLQDTASLEIFIKSLNWVLPNFYKLNLKDLVLYQQSVSSGYLATTFIYAMGYILFLVLSSLWIFKRKNLN